jgi:hypothetical protein
MNLTTGVRNAYAKCAIQQRQRANANNSAKSNTNINMAKPISYPNLTAPFQPNSDSAFLSTTYSIVQKMQQNWIIDIFMAVFILVMVAVLCIAWSTFTRWPRLARGIWTRRRARRRRAQTCDEHHLM